LRCGDGIVNLDGGGLFNFKSCFEFGDALPLINLDIIIVSESIVFGVGECIKLAIICCFCELFIVFRTNLATGDL
jgi:hypothetical protein